MIKSRHRPFYVWFFKVYTKVMLRKHFQDVILKGEFIDRGLPVLVIGNHFSWWDGFIAYYFNMKVFRRKFHIMMLEEQLAGRSFLNKAGAFSIKKGGRSVVESLDYAAGVLQHENNLVVLYPQGEFQSLHARPVIFEKGIRNIAVKLSSEFHLVFYAAMPDYFSEKKPTLTVYYREFSFNMASEPVLLQSEYNDFIRECSLQQTPR